MHPRGGRKEGWYGHGHPSRSLPAPMPWSLRDVYLHKNIKFNMQTVFVCGSVRHKHLPHKRAHGHSHVITFALHTASQHPKDQCYKQCSWTTEESFCHPPPRLGGNGDAFLRVVPLDCAEHRFILCCTVDEGWFAPFSVILAVAWWPIVPEKNEERPFGVNPS